MGADASLRASRTGDWDAKKKKKLEIADRKRPKERSIPWDQICAQKIAKGDNDTQRVTQPGAKRNRS